MTIGRKDATHEIEKAYEIQNTKTSLTQSKYKKSIQLYYVSFFKVRNDKFVEKVNRIDARVILHDYSSVHVM